MNAFRFLSSLELPIHALICINISKNYASGAAFGNAFNPQRTKKYTFQCKNVKNNWVVIIRCVQFNACTNTHIYIYIKVIISFFKQCVFSVKYWSILSITVIKLTAYNFIEIFLFITFSLFTKFKFATFLEIFYSISIYINIMFLVVILTFNVFLKLKSFFSFRLNFNFDFL